MFSVNKKCNMNMLPVGLDGIQETVDDIPELEISPDDRVAIIYEDSYFENACYDNLPVNLYINSGEIIRGMYNVLPISKSKGLEFEKVIVLANGMSDNEFYVACTRAISELYVIENKWFACNNAYCINEKKAIKLLETFEYKPKKYAERVNHIFDGSIQCLSPAKNYKLYKSSINKSLYFVQRSLSSGTRG